MKLLEALKTEKPIRRKGRDCWLAIPTETLRSADVRGWIEPEYFLSNIPFTRLDAQATDWEVKDDFAEIKEVLRDFKRSLMNKNITGDLEIRSNELFAHFQNGNAYMDGFNAFVIHDASGRIQISPGDK